MSEIKSLYIDKLIVWSDNPRHGLQVSNNNLSETDIINILIEVVGTEKMYNLIYDILENKGLLPNLMPVVVPHKDKYHVYDGNRRISALKIIKNPHIIEDEQLLKRVIKLVENKDISFVDNVSVCITEENEALDIMDKLHSGEQNGVGMISWEPYQRDISLFKRSKQLQYPWAFRICQALDYSMKSFTKDMPAYTDLDRLFKAKTLTDYFKINKDAIDFASRVEEAIYWLKEYKKALKFTSYSRQFNITGDKEDKGPIKEFCNWVNEQKKNIKKYQFQVNEIDIYKDEPFSFSKFGLKIYDSKKNEIKFDKKDISVEYISPRGITLTNIDSKQIGTWIVNIKYDGELCKTIVNVLELLKPRIDFSDQSISAYGETLDLKDLVIRATDSHGKDQKHNLIIEGISDCEISQGLFTGENSEGVYKIKYTFVDINGCPYSKTKVIQIVDRLNPLLPENRNIPLLSTTNKNCHINISKVVNKIIDEINNLNIEQNICIIIISLRTLVELVFDELQSNGKITFSEQGNLEKSLEDFKHHMLNGEMSVLCKNYKNAFPSYHTEYNCVNLINPSELSSYLNLATHKSILRVDITKVQEIAKKQVVPILMYTSMMLKLK